jgi:lipoyl(octanoyl) transferase
VMKPSTRWRLMLVPPRSGAENMARDSALMDSARVTGEYIFTVYSWNRPTLSLGRNQTAKDRYDLRGIAKRGIDVVRRPTGGRALLHWREVTYSVAGPEAEHESLSDSYGAINRILLDGLLRMGVEASESRNGERTPFPGDMPCFAMPAEGELTLHGSKIVGSAQVRENGAFLQHGSILVHDDQPLISSLLIEHSARFEPPEAATLAGALGREPSVEEVAAALFEAVKALEDPDATMLDESELEASKGAHLHRYRNPLWTWRR